MSGLATSSGCVQPSCTAHGSTPPARPPVERTSTRSESVVPASSVYSAVSTVVCAHGESNRAASTSSIQSFATPSPDSVKR